MAPPRYALMAGIGAAIGAVYLIPPAMLPDVIDEATLRDGGVRREAMFYAYFVFCKWDGKKKQGEKSREGGVGSHPPACYSVHEATTVTSVLWRDCGLFSIYIYIYTYLSDILATTIDVFLCCVRVSDVERSKVWNRVCCLAVNFSVVSLRELSVWVLCSTARPAGADDAAHSARPNHSRDGAHQLNLCLFLPALHRQSHPEQEQVEGVARACKRRRAAGYLGENQFVRTS